MSRSTADAALWRRSRRTAQPSPWLTMTFVESPFLVVGSTPRQLWRAANLLGPRCGARRERAFTSWRVRYRCVPLPALTGFRVGALRVDLVVERSLPSWLPPRFLEADALRACRRMLDRIREHEALHEHTGIAAAEALVQAIQTVGVRPSKVALRRDVDETASHVLEAFRQVDVNIDVESTRHGPVWADL